MTKIALILWIIAVVLMIAEPVSTAIGKRTGSSRFMDNEWVNRYRFIMRMVVCSLAVISASLLFFFT